MTQALPKHLYGDPAIAVENDDYRMNGCGGCVQNIRDRVNGGKKCNAGEDRYPYGCRWECPSYWKKNG